MRRYTLRQGWRRLRASTNGTAIIEFAIVAAAFFALLLAIFETALVMFAQQVLQTAVTQSARLIMTGQAQSQGLSATQFQQTACSELPSLFNCANLYVNVQTFRSFSSVSAPNAIVNGSFDKTTMSYDPGSGGDIVSVQLYYIWPIEIGPLGFNLSNMNNNDRLLVATASFRNEPF